MGPSGRDAITAELLDGELEEEGDVLARQNMRVVARELLDGRGQVEQVEEFVVAKVEVPEEVGGGHFGDLGWEEETTHI